MKKCKTSSRINNVMQDASNVTLDLDELRKEIGSIKGVGEKRLDEIMAVIERCLEK